MRPAIDLNADVGESNGDVRHGDDDAVIPYVTSASIACGGHAGDPETMRRACALARRHGAAVGAHVSYPDRDGFGRRALDIDAAALSDSLLVQLRALLDAASAAGTDVRYVKPHGALYHAMSQRADHASAVIDAVRAVDPMWPIVVLAGSLAAEAISAAGLTAVGEAFLDRAYLPDGGLVPRSDDGAVITDDSAVVARALRLAEEGTVITLDGEVLAVNARTWCLHGDTDGSAALLASVRSALDAAGVEVRAFA